MPRPTKPIAATRKVPKGPAKHRKGPEEKPPPTNPGPRRPKGPPATKAHVNKVARQVLRRGLKAVNAARVAKGMLPVSERVKARATKIPGERAKRKMKRQMWKGRREW